MFLLILIAAIVALVITGHVFAATVFGIVLAVLVVLWLLFVGTVLSTVVKQQKRVERQIKSRRRF